MDQSSIDRINTLYHKSQSVGLTEEEKEEQARLRKEYVAAIKKYESTFKQHFHQGERRQYYRSGQEIWRNQRYPVLKRNPQADPHTAGRTLKPESIGRKEIMDATSETRS